ncbi:MAG: phosphotransferase family protein [Spongiibacteraceae bacterium]
MNVLNEQFAARLAEVIQRNNPQMNAVVVTELARAFGGNARLAVSFELGFEQSGKVKNLPAILLSQLPGGHVDSSTEDEYAVLRALTGQGIATPAALALDAEGYITGAATLIMERVDGVASAVGFLNDNGDNSQPLTKQLATNTADLHQFDWSATGLSGSSDSPLMQVIEWENTFHQHRREPLPVMNYLFRWLKANIPTPVRLSLVHGDLRPGNFLYQGDKITALLDWEMAHIGDPAEDITWIYRELWSPQRFLSFEDFVASYTAHRGCHPGWKNLIFYRIFNEMKFATISLTASTSVATGQSDNMRHADRASKIPRCLELCFSYINEFNQVKDHAAA